MFAPSLQTRNNLAINMVQITSVWLCATRLCKRGCMYGVPYTLTRTRIRRRNANVGFKHRMEGNADGNEALMELDSIMLKHPLISPAMAYSGSCERVRLHSRRITRQRMACRYLSLIVLSSHLAPMALAIATNLGKGTSKCPNESRNQEVMGSPEDQRQ